MESPDSFTRRSLKTFVNCGKRSYSSEAYKPGTPQYTLKFLKSAYTLTKKYFYQCGPATINGMSWIFQKEVPTCIFHLINDIQNNPKADICRYMYIFLSVYILYITIAMYIKFKVMWVVLVNFMQSFILGWLNENVFVRDKLKLIGSRHKRQSCLSLLHYFWQLYHSYLNHSHDISWFVITSHDKWHGSVHGLLMETSLYVRKCNQISSYVMKCQHVKLSDFSWCHQMSWNIYLYNMVK